MELYKIIKSLNDKITNGLGVSQGSNGKWYIGYRNPVTTRTCSTSTGSFETYQDAFAHVDQITEQQLVRFEKKTSK